MTYSIAATQMWCLARLLPLMIGEEVEEGDQYWGNFLLLLSILDYCMAPIVSKDWAAYLRMIIQDHHQTFKQLYPSCPIIPKMHYIVHYPEIMCRYKASYNVHSTLEPCGKLELDKYMCALSFCRFGPLVKFWCMRFEGKHN